MTINAVPFARRLLAVAVLVACFFTLVPQAPAHAADSRTAARIQSIMERKINDARTSRGLRPLRIHTRLEYFAKDHAGWMARNRSLTHDSALELAREAPARAITWGENIAYNTAADSATYAHRGFMRSAPHRANILNPAYTHMGIGVVKRNGVTYFVQRFATIP